MAPFVGGDDVPWWSRLSAAELAGWVSEQAGYDHEAVVPELPVELVEADAGVAERYAAGEWVWSTEPDCCCEGRCLCGWDPTLRERTAQGVPVSLAAAFEVQFRAQQRATAASWRAAVALHEVVLAERGPLAAEHVGSELAVRMGVHPRTGMTVMVTALRAVREVPRLVELVEAGCLSDRHVSALLDEVGKWTDSTEQARLVLEQTLARCAERADRYGWPTPGEIKRVLKRVAVLHDLHAAEKKRRSVAERRGVSLTQTGAGAAALVIEGPDLPLLLAMRAISERAEAMQHLQGDTRSREQREYDAFVELVTIDADMPVGGGISARPTTGLHGEPLELVVRGAHVAVVMPYSIAEGGQRELAEVPGFGYLLPSAARELAEHADSLTRVAVDSLTGEVLAVDDPVPGPDRARRRDRHHTPEQAPLIGETTDVPTDALRDASWDEPPTDPEPEPEPEPNDDPDEWPDHEPDDGQDGGTGGGPGGGGGGPEPGPPAPAPPSSAAAADNTEPSTEQEAAPDPASARLAAMGAALDAPRDLPPEPSPPGSGHDPTDTALSPDTLALLRALADRKVIWRDLCTSSYRAPNRLRRYLEHRDRTCCYPGCTVPGRYCDVDHREEWPRGGTHTGNCHVLCRRHHRAKQFYFATVTLDPTTGDTCWTTDEGSTYRRPPPRW